MSEVLIFEDAELAVIHRNGERWLTARDIAAALGYADGRKVIKIYDRSADEFSEAMTCIVKLTVQSGQTEHPYGDLRAQTGDAGADLRPQTEAAGPTQRRDVRVFSLRGAHLIAMLARTDRAKAFRRWVLDLLDGPAEAQPPAHAPLLALDGRPWVHDPEWRSMTAGRRAHWQGVLFTARRRLWDLGDMENGLPPMPEIGL